MIVKLDKNAHSLLSEIKEKLRKEGIDAPSFSDAVRYLYSKYKEVEQ